MNVVFLDVDGVLNNRKSMIVAHEQGLHPPGPLGNMFTVDPEAVARFRALVERLDLKIVVSSTWRFHPHALKTALNWCGWEKPPIIANTDRDGPKRGNEIGRWLDQQMMLHVDPVVKSYCIIDDDSDMLPEQMENFVKTDNVTGLTDENIEQMIAVYARQGVAV